MRRIDGEVLRVRPSKMKGVMDPAPADIGGFEPFCRIVAASSLDIVDHQVEGGCGSGFRRLFRLSYDDMSAAAELKDSEVGVLEYRA